MADINPKQENKSPADPMDSFCGMSVEEIRQYVQIQYAMLEEKGVSLQQQLVDLKKQIYSDNDSVIQRIERVLALMNTQMALIKQMVELVDNFGDRLHEQEEFKTKHELEYIGIVERQNRFAANMQNMVENSKQIFMELEEIKSHQEQHDKFQWRFVIAFSIGASIVIWLVTGDHFANLLKLISGQ